MARLFALFLLLSAAAPAAELKWLPWSDDVFQRAAREHRFVLLNLHAVWCHWCHVMEKETYTDPEVIRLLQQKYLLVEVDADSRPDLANRYEDYGWPATIVFDEKGGEIVKRRGYLPPELMRSLLQAIIDDPTPGPSVEPPHEVKYAAEGAMPVALQKDLEQRLREGYDTKLASWGDTLKFLEWDNTEYCLRGADSGDQQAQAMLMQTFTAQDKLIDPIWGGVYQYSAEGDWEHPHFEKLIQFQAENLRLYALADLQYNNLYYAERAKRIHDYVKNFLTSPEGAFYVSQDADLVDGIHAGAFFSKDDAGRRKQGMPCVDTHIYTRENGWMIRGLCTWYRASGDEAVLAEARRAAEWIGTHRADYQHGESTGDGRFLGDAVSIGQAYLELYAVTGERPWLAKAQAAADFVEQHFVKDPAHDAGLVTGDVNRPRALAATPQYDENVAAVRFCRSLGLYTHETRYQRLAECAMRYLATAEVLERRHAFIGGALLAQGDMAAESLHLTVVGPKDDPLARELFLVAQKAPGMFRRTEWYDAREGRLPGLEVAFPPLAKAAIFACTAQSCSAPISDPAAVAKKWEYQGPLKNWHPEGSSP